MTRLLLLLPLFFLASCSQPNEEQSSSSKIPKSFYGQSVKKARELQAPSEEEEETKRQAKELLKDE